MKSETVDVVVIGSGAAGLSAALSATLRGASVIVLEKSALIGGTSAVSGGGMWLPSNSAARALGVDDPFGRAKPYIEALTLGQVDVRVLDAYLRESHTLVEWLQENSDLVIYADPERPDYQSELPGAVSGGRLVGVGEFDTHRLGEYAPLLRRPNWPGGIEPVRHDEMRAFIDAGNPDGWIQLVEERIAKGIVLRGCGLVAGLLHAVVERGGRVVTEVGGRDLIQEGGRVAGVIAFDADGREREFRARQGVILASGGFEWNERLWQGLISRPFDDLLSPPENTGDGLRMAEQAGALLGNLQNVWWQVRGGAAPGSIAVNRAGARFANECLNYQDLGTIVTGSDPTTYQFPNYPAFEITAANAKTTEFINDPNQLGDQAKNMPIMEAPTLRELAEMAGIDPDGLERQVEEFNRHAAEGKDPQFHRGESSWDLYRKAAPGLANPTLAPLSQGPYRARQIKVNVFGTRGGPVIDEAGRVLDHDSVPIPGLYASGNVTASLFGQSYPGGGSTLGPAVIFGKLSGIAVTE